MPRFSTLMTILGLILTLAVIGLLLWLINTYVPMEPTIKRIMNIVVAIAVVFWILQVFGLLTAVNRPIHW